MIIGMTRSARVAVVAALGALAMIGSAAAPAQVQSVDPDRAIDGDLSAPVGTPTSTVTPEPVMTPTGVDPAQQAEIPAAQASPAAEPVQNTGTYQKDDLIGAAEGVFGKGAAGLAGLIEDLLRKQGEPNAYITGREGGGALIVGVRYGSGTLYHKIEGQRPVYWTGPSVGLDAGANAASTFVLVYNLYNSEDIYKRFPAGEGQAYLVGGFNVSYLRKGDVVLIPIRMGVGLRLGVNAGYMKFSKKQKWLPF
ncbi:MAG TPA: DUF1134 domain-containing protein [Novosphingobium sp.]|nr:DUF1134 domain-containing protein [Novosphingobium sp.]